MRSIGGLSGIGAPISNNQIGGENFIRHVGADKAIYQFKEGSGTTVRDDSHCGNNGTFGATTAAPTWQRNSLYFDGGDHIVLTGINHGITTGGFTFCTHLSNWGNGLALFMQTTATFLGINHGNAIKMPYATAISKTGVNSISPIIVQMTRNNSGSLKCYINSLEEGIGASNTSNIIYNGTSEVLLGANTGPSTQLLGTMYSFRILNKGLSGIECQQEYLANRWRANN